MIKNPFFSIVIPTYKRANSLKLAIGCILMQDFSDFEIIIFDNNSNDGTEDVVKKFKDRRIKYSKNTKNIGWIPSLRKAIHAASGDYIILHGDDDFMLYDNTLKTINDIFKKRKLGFVRVNYVNIFKEKKAIFNFHNELNRDLEINSKEENKKIINFIERVDPFFITGIIYKNDLPKNIDLIDSELSAWFKIIFYSTYKGGAYFLSKHFFAASWSKNAAYPRYYLADGKFKFENYFNEVKKVLSKKEYNNFLKKRLKIVIKELPACKYYTSNKNLLVFSKRILEIFPSFKFSFIFWFWTLVSLLTPRFTLGLYRIYFINQMIKNSEVPNSQYIKNIIFKT